MAKNIHGGYYKAVDSILFRPDGGTIVYASRPGTLKVPNARTGKNYNILLDHFGPIENIVFIPDGQKEGAACAAVEAVLISVFAG